MDKLLFDDCVRRRV